MRLRGPLADSYPAAAALVVLALVPYLALSSALTPLTPVVGRRVGLSPQALQLAAGMANAAYAFGTVVAVQLAVHWRPRRMLVCYAALFTLGSVLAALALDPAMFVAGHVLQGGCTSLMLIAAVPPLVTGWPAKRMPWTGAIMNLCIFGAVAAGPSIGSVQAAAQRWRPLFWIVAGIGALALAFALLTFEDAEPQDPEAPWDWVAMGLAALGCAAAFFGASELATHPMTSPVALAPLAGGAVLIVGLVAHQYAVRHPLMPLRLVSTTLPVAGIVVAMSAGAVSVAAIELAQTALMHRPAPPSPLHVAVLFLPELGGAIVTAGIFGALFRTRFTPLLAFAGMLALTGGAAALTGVASAADSLVAAGAGLIGLGVGASVSPALFIAGFSLRSTQIQRVFALIELLRGVAAFVVAPIVLHVAMTVARTPAAGVAPAMGLCVALAGAGTLAAVALYAAGGTKLQRPDLERWEGGDEPAWESPPLAAAVRGGRE
ncbi:MAG: MFS transporter [Solirubrobacteraceae bacterium]